MEFPYIVNLCYIFNEKGEVLLQKKARGFGKGNWNGPGGKVETGETPEESVVREVAEETGIIIKKPEKAGEIEFIFENNYASNNYTHVYTASDWSGIPEDKGEGELRWFNINNIPLDKMWDDDKYWLPDVLNGAKVHKRFYFNKYNKVTKQLELKS